MANEYYNTLGVEKNATESEIKSAYRKLAKQYHPDLNPGNEQAAAKFKEINEAYETLGDANKRAQYDANGGNTEPQGFGGFGGFNGFGGEGGFGDIFDIFSAFTGGGSRRGAQEDINGRDVTINLTLTFEEAILGCTKEITVTKNVKCSTCNGTGAKDGKKYKTCSTCNGTGKVQRVMNSMFGRTVTVAQCDACGGTGRIIEEKCSDCRGSGFQRKTSTIRVDIPKGVENGTVLTMREGGDASKFAGGKNGNLVIVLNVRPHKLISRRGLDLYVDVSVPFSVAALGGKIQIPTVTGMIEQNIPDGTQSGHILRMRGKGVTSRNGQTGDLYINISVEIPKKLSKEQKALFKKLSESIEIGQYAKYKDYNDKMKDLYREKK